MRRYVARRLLQMVPVLLLVTFGVYSLLLLLPGDPVLAMLSESEQLDQRLVEQYRRDLGLDRPVPVQYALWLGRFLQGDWGKSIKTNRPVAEEIRARLPATLHLGLFAWVISLLIAIPTGVIAATRRGTPFDHAATAFAVGGVAIPSFWQGIILILVFAVFFRLVPVSGFVSFTEDPLRSLKHLVLPAVTLGTSIAAVTMRQTRSAMLEVLAQDYVRTARAKGLREPTVLLDHALRNALLPVVTIMGLQVGNLIGGSVIIETIFAVPGVGSLAVSSIFNRDFPVVQALVFIVALSVMTANLLTDLAYGVLDPRIRYR